MRILSIRLKNIKSHRDLDLSFSPGINVLAGPNGIGKSTIFEAIGYALFGVDAQSFVGNVERFISIGAKKGEITILFEARGERFQVSRTVGTPAKWLLAKEVGGAFEVEEHKDIRETEARLKELLGLENGRSLAEQFELVIGPFQHEFLGPFVIRQPTRRRDKFDEILGIDTWRKTFTRTNALLKAIANKVSVLESAIGPLKEQVAVLPEKRSAHKDAKQHLARTEQEFHDKGLELQKLEERLVEIDRREQKIKALGTEIDKLKERIDNGRERVAGQKTLIAEAEKSRRVVSENMAGKQACEQAEKRLVELREQAKVQRRLEQEMAQFEKQLSALTARHAAEGKAIERAMLELADEERNLTEKRGTLKVDQTTRKLAARLPEVREAIIAVRSRLGQLDGRRTGLEEGKDKLAEGVCPFFREPCLNIAEKPPGDLFSTRLTELATERESMEKELTRLEQAESEASRAAEQLKTFEVQLRTLDEQAAGLAEKRKANQKRAAGLERSGRDRDALQRQLTEKQAALKEYANLAATIEQMEAEQKRHRPARDLYMAHREQASRLEGLQTDLRKFEQLLARLQQDLKAGETKLRTMSGEYDAVRHQALRRQKDELGREVGALGQKAVGLGKDVKRLADEIDRLKQIETEITARQAQVRTWEEKEKLVRFLRNRVFRNVSSYLSERFREEISQRANRIYRIIAEADEELAWGEDYRIVLRDLHEGQLRERADDQLSGGQTMSAVVALRLAMLQTIGARIAFFDEPTSNLDAARRENLAQAFRAIDIGREEVTEHWYDQLFLVSHDIAFSEITDQILDLEGRAETN
ncbi:SMC family ATPase [Geothermobacter hydrogeniphilus]|uniref:SMC family ATPase n=1 Tax=Geothermobacter hydrogeniphilus TaxID=1969733 RepID=A0A2K2HB85_9BACT|nr:SMC family ATPase [Geothermobacter hydrogeniphilus]PNU20574.1 SMC family ATPase [Geothermobacter hydrogeniphilus]